MTGLTSVYGVIGAALTAALFGVGGDVRVADGRDVRLNGLRTVAVEQRLTACGKDRRWLVAQMIAPGTGGARFRLTPNAPSVGHPASQYRTVPGARATTLTVSTGTPALVYVAPSPASSSVSLALLPSPLVCPPSPQLRRASSEPALSEGIAEVFPWVATPSGTNLPMLTLAFSPSGLGHPSASPRMVAQEEAAVSVGPGATETRVAQAPAVAPQPDLPVVASRPSASARPSAPAGDEPKPRVLRGLSEAELVARLQTAGSYSAILIDPMTLEVSMGMFLRIPSRGRIRSIAIADPQVADVVVMSSRQALLNGIAPGRTSAIVTDDVSTRHYEVVVTSQAPTPADEVVKAIGLKNVKVEMIKDSLVLEGSVDSQAEARRAKEIAAIYGKKVVDLLDIKEKEAAAGAPAIVENPELARQIERTIGMDGVKVTVVGDTVILRGTVDKEEQKTQAEEIAKVYGAKVVNLLKRKLPTLAELRDLISNPAVALRESGGQLILEGTVADAGAAEQATRIAATSGREVVNRLRVGEPPPPAGTPAVATRAAEALKIPGVQVSGDAEKLTLKGVVDTEAEKERALEQAAQYAKTVEDKLEIRKPEQVRVNVDIVEVGRANLRDLGVSYPPLTSGGPVQFGEKDGTPSGPIVRFTPFEADLKAFLQKTGSKVLSSPRTTVLSGVQAKFEVGGELPIPTTSATGTGISQQSVEFRPFGIIMEVTPKVNRVGDVHMKVKVEITAPDWTRVVRIGTSDIPSFTRKSTETEVHVANSATLVISGLMSSSVTKTMAGLPLLSQIPVLGELFMSKRFQREETELVIFVTPKSGVTS